MAVDNSNPSVTPIDPVGDTATVVVTKRKLDGLADAIKAKAGTTQNMTIDEMVSAVKTLSADSGAGGNVTLQEKTIEITKNGTITITPDAGYDGFSKLVLTINVAIEQLEAPTNVTVNAAALTFDSVENAEKYALLVDGVEITTI